MKNKITYIILIIAISLYLFGYNIAHYLYNSHGLIGDEKKDVIKSFWKLRFSLYSLILMLVFYTGKINSTGVLKSIYNVGFNLALISTIDKMILHTYSFGKYDYIIIPSVIIYEIIKYNYEKSFKK